MYAIAIVLLPHYVRLTRAAVMAEAGKEYVASSRIAGTVAPTNGTQTSGASPCPNVRPRTTIGLPIGAD